MGEQFLRLVPEHGIVDEVDELPLLFREVFESEVGVDRLLETVLDLIEVVEEHLDRTDDVRDIRLRTVVQQAGQDDPVGVAAALRFLRTVDAVLTDRQEVPDLAHAPADEAQGVRDVIEPDVVRLHILRVQQDAGDGVHGAAGDAGLRVEALFRFAFCTVQLHRRTLFGQFFSYFSQFLVLAFCFPEPFVFHTLFSPSRVFAA